jgi:NADPH:quinone reductase-like Zn-dependent oxidoreductase
MFNAFRVFDENGKISGRIVQISLDDLSDGAVVIKAAYSSVNYKDALAATGKSKIMRRFPLVGGIDVAGTVESSADARFKAGDPVLVTATTWVWRTTAVTPPTRECRPSGWCPPGWPVSLRRDGHRHRGIHGGTVRR